MPKKNPTSFLQKIHQSKILKQISTTQKEEEAGESPEIKEQRML